MHRLAELLPFPALLLSPYDAELFGHWWYEGPEFLDFFVRKAFYDQKDFTLATPEDYLRQHPTHQAATPAASSWGEGGYWRVWLNEKNHWIYPHLHAAQERMTELARSHAATPDAPRSDASLADRALKQAARELMLAQASDWSFILRTGTTEYAADRVRGHLARFTRLYEQLRSNAIDEPWLAFLETVDNLFPDIDYRYWA